MRNIVILMLILFSGKVSAQSPAQQRILFLSYMLSKINKVDVGMMDTVKLSLSGNTYSVLRTTTKTRKYAELVENVIGPQGLQQINRYEFFFARNRQLHTLQKNKTKLEHQDTIYNVRDKYSFFTTKISGKKSVILRSDFQDEVPYDETIVDTFGYNSLSNVNRKRAYYLPPIGALLSQPYR